MSMSLNGPRAKQNQGSPRGGWEGGAGRGRGQGQYGAAGGTIPSAAARQNSGAMAGVHGGASYHHNNNNSSSSSSSRTAASSGRKQPQHGSPPRANNSSNTNSALRATVSEAIARVSWPRFQNVFGVECLVFWLGLVLVWMRLAQSTDHKVHVTHVGVGRRARSDKGKGYRLFGTPRRHDHGLGLSVCLVFTSMFTRRCDC